MKTSPIMVSVFVGLCNLYRLEFTNDCPSKAHKNPEINAKRVTFI